MRLLSIFLLLVSLHLGFCQEKEHEELVVTLKTQENLLPVYLAKIKHSNAALSPDYLAQIEKVLAFDLSYSGRISMYGHTKECESTFEMGDIKLALAHDIWKRNALEFVVVPKVEMQKLSVFIFSVKQAQLKILQDIHLSGLLTEDRRTIHRIADAVHKVLFGVDGIASTKILYALQVQEITLQGTNWKSEIFEADYDGENARQITQDGTYCINPLFYSTFQRGSLDRFLYVTYKSGPPKIFFASKKDPVGEPFVQLRGNQILPTLCKNKDILAFISDAGGKPDLFVQYLDRRGKVIGKPIQAFSYPMSVQASPTFSPDGSKIAFVSDKDGSPKIYVIDTPKLHEKNYLPQPVCITTKNKENTCPNWSPDGRKLTYSATTGGVRQVWVYDFSTGEEKQLTAGPGNKENPVWGPNSFHILYNTTGQTSELFLTNLSQTGTVKITSGPGKKHYPAWEP